MHEGSRVLALRLRDAAAGRIDRRDRVLTVRLVILGHGVEGRRSGRSIRLSLVGGRATNF